VAVSDTETTTKSVPHVRGDEPRELDGLQMQEWRSPRAWFDDHPAAVSAISTSAGMPRLLCNLRIMASVSGRLRLRTS